MEQPESRKRRSPSRSRRRSEETEDSTLETTLEDDDTNDSTTASPSKRSKSTMVLENNKENAPSQSKRSSKRKSSKEEVDEAVEHQSESESENEEPDEEEEDEDEAEEEAITTLAAARSRTSIPSTIQDIPISAEAGILKEIYCEDFMCHQRFRLQLHRNINFIHGQNGSGKSAILAAIQICLGASAKRTNRARNLKDLVRRDGSANVTQAIIAVTLHNKGSDAYKHELYGDTIMVERTISLASGYNGYKLKDSKGVEKSRKKSDLDDMLDTLNIQVDNPVAVLDQEEAKKFLTGKASDKYNFFLKATELERIDRSYAATLDNLDDTQTANVRHRAGLQAQYDHVVALKAEYNRHQQLGLLEQKKEKLCLEWSWAYFNQLDDLYQTAVQEKEQFQLKAEKKREELTQAEESIQDNPDAEQAKNDLVNELVTEAETQLNLKETLMEEKRALLGPKKESERQLSRLVKQQSAANKQLAAAQRRLKGIREEIFAQAGSQSTDEARRTAQLAEAEIALAEARDKVDSLRQDQSTFLRKFEEVEPHVQDARQESQRLDRKVNALEKNLKDLQSSTGLNRLGLLGPRVAAVAKMVDEAKKSGKFRGPVLGPIGSYLKVAPGKEPFAGVAEHALGNGTLDRFIVTNDPDMGVLRDIRKRAGCKQDCSVFQIHPSSRRFDVPPPPSIEGIETIASVFSIEDDTVFNCLVDNGRIEKKAIARDRKFGEAELLIKNGGKNSIRGNLKEVYCLPKGDYFTVKGGALATFSNDRQLKQTVGVDKTAAIAAAQLELEQAGQELMVKKQEASKLDHDHNDFRRQWSRAKKAVQQNDTAIQELSERMDNIREEIESSANVTVDTTEYEEDVKQAQETVESLKGSEQGILAEVEEHKPRLQDVQNRIDECDARNARVKEDLNAAQNVLTQLLQTQSQLSQQVEKKRQKLMKYLEIVSKHDESIGLQTKDRDKALLDARKLHFNFQQRQLAKETEDPETSEAIRQKPTEADLEAIEPKTVKNEPNYYMTRINKLKDKITNERNKRNMANDSDPAEAFERYTKARTTLNETTAAIDETDAKTNSLQADLHQRQKRWKLFRKSLSHSTGLKFDQLLNMNACSGELAFNFEDGTLDLSMQKDLAKGASKDVKALSGGERSYTTMCLLIALGETLETPFRILDEFDVFLDAQVRKLTINSLIYVAKKMCHRQFIFITPQDLSSVKPDTMVKIHRLVAPDRHDNAGGPSQQTLNFASQP